MSDTFTISPSEALLLGLCLEEYLKYEAEPRYPPRRTFLDVLTTRLMPHVNTLRQTRYSPTARDSFPEDIEWTGPLGRSTSSPDRVFFDGSENAFVVTFDFSRRSLLDQLVNILWPDLSKSHYDRFNVAPNAVDASDGWLRFITNYSQFELILEKEGSDSKDRIRSFIERLAEENECSEPFKIGRKFGAVVYAIDEFESYVWSIEEKREEYVEEIRSEMWMDEGERITLEAEDAAREEYERWLAEELPTLLEAPHDDVTDEQWAESISKAIEEKRVEIFDKHAELASDATAEAEPPPAEQLGIEFRPKKNVLLRDSTKALLETDLVNRCPHARSLLERASQIENWLVFDLTGDLEVDVAQRQTIPHIADARMALWLAFGEILGVLKDVDVVVNRADSAAAVSRAFKLQPADTPDVVMDRLLSVEGELNSRADIAPEEVIERLSPVIEALAKRVWPQDFMPAAGYGGKRLDFATILYNRLTEHRQNNEHDRRFASIALALCKQYRNPAVHDLGSFKCTFEEARFFLAGIRALVDLWKNWPPNATEPKRLTQ
jgi:hypothetical protein